MENQLVHGFYITSVCWCLPAGIWCLHFGESVMGGFTVYIAS